MLDLDRECLLVKMVDALSSAPSATPLDRVLAYCRAGIATEAIVALDARAVKAADVKRQVFGQIEQEARRHA